MENTVIGRIISGTLSLLILAAGVAGYWFLTTKPEQQLEAVPQALPPLVETVPIEPHVGTLDIHVDGVVVPFREIDISAEIPGRIATKSDRCQPGTFVRQGELLVQIDARDYQFEVDRLQAQLAESEAMLEELEVEISNTLALKQLTDESVQLARNELLRLRNLAGVVSQSDTDRAQREEVSARNASMTLQNQAQLLKQRRTRLESSRELVKTGLEKAQLDLERTRVMAPVDGVLVKTGMEQGDFVAKGDLLFQIEDTSAVEIKCNLRMEEVYWLRHPRGEPDSAVATSQAYGLPPTPVTVSYQLPQTSQHYEWSGRLDRFDGLGLDEKTRTVPCRIVVPSPLSGRSVTASGQPLADADVPPLVRGMYVTIELHLEPSTTLIRLPERAVRPGKTAWMFRDGKLEMVSPLRLIELMTLPVATASAGLPAGAVAATPAAASPAAASPAKAVTSELERVWIADAEASGLQVGERIIVSPMVAVYPQMPVRERTDP